MAETGALRGVVIYLRTHLDQCGAWALALWQSLYMIDYPCMQQQVSGQHEAMFIHCGVLLLHERASEGSATPLHDITTELNIASPPWRYCRACRKGSPAA